MVSSIMIKKTAATLLIGALGLTMAQGCGQTDVPPPPQKLKISVVGWGPDGESESTEMTYVDGMPAYEGASQVRVIGTVPADNRIVARELTSVEGGAAKMPALPYDEAMRLELEVLDISNEVIATGSSSVFTITEDTTPQAFNVMMSPINEFSPSVAVYRQGEERIIEDSTLDYRVERLRLQDLNSTQPAWLGRVGHGSAVLSDGRVLIVGGTPNVLSGNLDSPITMSSVYGDVQVYDPETGYFTDLNLNEDESAPQSDGKDRLTDARAFHTVTPIGDDRFIVTGGYTVRTLPDGAKQTRPVLSIELINMNAPHGERVVQVTDSIGQTLQLGTPRAYHEAVYVEQGEGDDAKLWILLIGGRGRDSGTTQTEDKVISEIELIDLSGLRVIGQRVDTGVPRVDHEVQVLGDGSILIAGGRNKDGVLASTQLVTFGATSVSVEDGPDLNQARYGFGLELVEGGSGRSVIAVGGYTAADYAAVTDSVELGVANINVGFSLLPSQKLATARGGLESVVLPHSGDIMLFGGRAADGSTVTSAERLRFNGITETPPYERVNGNFGEMRLPRYDATYDYMTNGRVFVFGGVDQREPMKIIAQDKAELYNPYDPVGEVR